MRIKAEKILEFGESDGRQNSIVREYRDEYKSLSEILDKQPKILDLVHRDLDQLSKATSPRGRKPTFTSENLSPRKVPSS
jgi:hypothetical protein